MPEAVAIPCPVCGAPAGISCSADGQHFGRIVRAEALEVGNTQEEP